jgi:hypothetical protein
MSNNFSALTPVQSGQDIRSVCNADRINAIQDLLMSLWQGENIHVGRGGSIGRGIGGVDLGFKGGKGGSAASAGCVPWTPTIKNTALPGATDPIYKLFLSPGTVGGFLSVSWNTGLFLPDDEFQRYIVLDISLEDAKVTAVSYTLLDALPSASDVNPVTKDSLPALMKIIMGTVKNKECCMVHNTNLNLQPYKSHLEPKTSPTYGLLPYDIYWGIRIVTVD